MTESAQRHAFTALAAAALFGASVPLSKLLLGDLGPLALAGLLYLGSGAGLALVWVARASMNGVTGTESGISRLTTADLPSLAGSILCGGILAPVMLLWGLGGLDAASTSLLLNAESVLTMLLAAVVFAEHVSGRLWLASLVMLVAGAVLAWQPAASLPVSLHALAVLAACLMWGMDNNLTRRIAGGDALTRRFAEDFRKAHGKEPTVYNANYYNGCRLFGLLAAELEKTNTPVTGDSLKDTLHRVKKFPLVGGVGEFDAQGNMMAAIEVVQWKGGQLVKLA